MKKKYVTCNIMGSTLIVQQRINFNVVLLVDTKACNQEELILCACK